MNMKFSQRYLVDYENVVDEKASNKEELLKLAGNPIHAYSLMKRLTLHWGNVENKLKDDHWKGDCDV